MEKVYNTDKVSYPHLLFLYYLSPLLSSPYLSESQTTMQTPSFTRPEPKKWLSKSYWVLETPPASYATHDGWSNADVDVVPVEHRTWRA